MLKLVLITLALVAASSAAPGTLKWLPLQGAYKMTQGQPAGAVQGSTDGELEAKWNDFKAKHGKTYKTSQEEEKRKSIFGTHLKVIAEHNALHAQGKKSYRLGINQYADMEHKEFVGIMNGYKMRDPTTLTVDRATYMSPLATVNLPEEVDWRTKGYVTPVKNQGQCGSCWAFSTTGSLEGQHFRQTGKLVSLSEQNLVDCSTRFGNHGCNGGLMDNAFQYIKENDGIDTEKSYPYHAEEGRCHFKSRNIGATDVGFVDVVPHGSEKKLKEAVASVGPVSVAIDASHRSFQLYESGVYDEPNCSSEQLDHGVLVVGYGTDEIYGDYWIVKNSWGPTWGLDGFVKMSRNKENQCGVATQASYPLV